MHISIIGAGAAGCFAAIEIKRRNPSFRVTVFESGSRSLAKVSITGGGRCNLTNSFKGIKSIESAYPRGAKLMKRLFHEFDHRDTYRWFEAEGVRLVTQEDECVFPESQQAMEIVDTLLARMNDMHVELKTNSRVQDIKKADGGFTIRFQSNTEVHTNCVLVCTGGSPKNSGLDMLKSFQLDIAEPVPSLFSFCIPGHPLTSLMGTVVSHAVVSIPGTKQKAEGPLLLTHWGMSGPAILKLSSYAARLLHECNYAFPLIVNWLGACNEEEARQLLSDLRKRNPQKLLSSVHPEVLNARLWEQLLLQAGLNPSTRWSELSNKMCNKLVSTLTGSTYNIRGKNRFKDEFVTCGGVSLSNLNPNTLESKLHPGLYFAGEVLDVDAITGGFNLQAAWTMGFVAAKSIASKL